MKNEQLIAKIAEYKNTLTHSKEMGKAQIHYLKSRIMEMQIKLNRQIEL